MNRLSLSQRCLCVFSLSCSTVSVRCLADSESETGSLVDNIIDRYNEEESVEDTEETYLEVIKHEGMLRCEIGSTIGSKIEPKIESCCDAMKYGSARI